MPNYLMLSYLILSNIMLSNLTWGNIMLMLSNLGESPTPRLIEVIESHGNTIPITEKFINFCVSFKKWH